jgi:hypothetical protein
LKKKISFSLAWYDSGNNEALYLVHDYSPHCACESAPFNCSLWINGISTNRTTSQSNKISIEVSEGMISAPLRKTGPISGRVVQAIPNTACQPLSNFDDVAGNIVIIDRYTENDCVFETKVKKIKFSIFLFQICSKYDLISKKNSK